ncbi:MAG: hypothetical protein R3B90_10850 [Planctomycetaceae bacterium]
MAKTADSSGGNAGPAKSGPSWFDSLRLLCLVIIGVSLTVSFARLLSVQQFASANDRSRWCTVAALVEEGTYAIDNVSRRPGWDSIDKVRHNEHFFSSKPPLFSTLVAGVY